MLLDIETETALLSRTSDRRRSLGSAIRAAENAGSIGSSRPPRSTRTASATLAGRPKSNSSLITARIVRPVYSTSSMSRIGRSSTSNGSFVWSAPAASPRDAEVVAMQRAR